MKISVIIPAFNARETIGASIESLTKNAAALEIFVIDDGSTDGTAALLDDLKKDLPALRFETVRNGGPAAARNYALSRVTGDYIAFCDSDDVYEPGAIDALLFAAEKNEADLVIGGFFIPDEKGDKAPYRYQNAVLAAPEDFSEHFAPLYRANMLNQVWAKLFSRKLLEGLVFPDRIWGEDRLFFFEALRRARRVAVIEECVYDYIPQKSSLISRFLPEKPAVCREVDRAVRETRAWFGDIGEDEAKTFEYMYVKSVFSVIATLFSPTCPLRPREKRAYLKTLLKECDAKAKRAYPAGCGKSFLFLARVFATGNAALNYVAFQGVAALTRLAPALSRRAKHAYNRSKGE